MTIACLAVVVGGCTTHTALSRDLETTLVVPDQLPAGMTLRGGCTVEGLGAAVLVYRGDGRYKSERRLESAFLRIAAFDLNARDTFDDPDFDVDAILDEALSGSITDTTVRGNAATGFSVSAADDPGPLGWPALVWTEGTFVFWITSEGLVEADVRLVAESLQPSTNEEYLELVEERICGS